MRVGPVSCPWLSRACALPMSRHGEENLTVGAGLTLTPSAGLGEGRASTALLGWPQERPEWGNGVVERGRQTRSRRPGAEVSAPDRRQRPRDTSQTTQLWERLRPLTFVHVREHRHERSSQRDHRRPTSSEPFVGGGRPPVSHPATDSGHPTHPPLSQRLTIPVTQIPPSPRQWWMVVGRGGKNRFDGPFGPGGRFGVQWLERGAPVFGGTHSGPLASNAGPKGNRRGPCAGRQLLLTRPRFAPAKPPKP